MARIIRFLGRSRLWLEVVGHRLGEVAQWGKEEGVRRWGKVFGGWGGEDVEQEEVRETE